MKRNDFMSGAKKKLAEPVAVAGELSGPNTIRMEIGKASITLCESGNIYINDRLAENDMAVVDGFRKLITTANNPTQEL